MLAASSSVQKTNQGKKLQQPGLLDSKSSTRKGVKVQVLSPVADRPDRFEPRLKKQRQNYYDWLTKPLAEMKRKMAKGIM